jgi:murein DD-endopeptidase MepM/ murein hydrolase activator NlpD
MATPQSNAHAKELLVNRDDQIKRGQVIAHSGQTGNVNAPQLHFEVRKGVTPLDPQSPYGANTGIIKNPR